MVSTASWLFLDSDSRCNFTLSAVNWHQVFVLFISGRICWWCLVMQRSSSLSTRSSSSAPPSLSSFLHEVHLHHPSSYFTEICCWSRLNCPWYQIATSPLYLLVLSPILNLFYRYCCGCSRFIRTINDNARKARLGTFIKQHSKVLLAQKNGDCIIVYTDESYSNVNHSFSRTWYSPFS